ncbi:MAG: DUF349 domain-containing protein [Thermonemataceae bacterium]|nr:DUF349 domain-containing protein [Thermonemataceae bacterium]
MNTNYSHPYGYISEGKVFLKGYLDMPDREIGLVKESPEAAILYFENRYKDAQAKVEELAKAVETAENKGSFLMKLLHLREFLKTFKGLGNFVILLEKLDELETYLRSLIDVNRKRNLEIKNAIIDELYTLIEDTNWKETAQKIEELKSRWIKTGAVEPHLQEEVEDKFSTYLKRYHHHKKEFLKNKADELKNRLNQYRILVDKASIYKLSDDFENTVIIFKELQNEWKNIGKVPQKKLEKYWERFKRINNEFFFRYKQYKEGIPIDAIKPLDPVEQARSVQERLCKKAESLVGTNTEESINEAKELLVAWKNEVTNPRYLDKNLANRFRYACDRIFEEAYLMKVVTRKYPDFYKKPALDQFRIKNSFLRELIRKDEQEVSVAESSTEYKPEHKSFNLATQKRKIQVKQIMLEEFEGELKKIYQKK